MPHHTTLLTPGQTFSLLEHDQNILAGLVLHKEVITSEFEAELIQFVQNECEKGRQGQIKARELK
jgi:hypothetical protein